MHWSTVQALASAVQTVPFDSLFTTHVPDPLQVSGLSQSVLELEPHAVPLALSLLQLASEPPPEPLHFHLSVQAVSVSVPNVPAVHWSRVVLQEPLTALQVPITLALCNGVPLFSSSN